MDLPVMSDHSSVCATAVFFDDSATTNLSSVRRDWSSFDIDSFRSALASSKLVVEIPDTCDQFFMLYDSTLKTLLDDVAPLKQPAANRRRAPSNVAPSKLRLDDSRRFTDRSALMKRGRRGEPSSVYSALRFSVCMPSTGQPLSRSVLIREHCGASSTVCYSHRDKQPYRLLPTTLPVTSAVKSTLSVLLLPQYLRQL